MSSLIQRAEVVLGAAVTYVVAAAVGLSAAADEIAAAAPDAGQDAIAWLIRAAAALTAIVTIVRRVAPVAPELRGLLPPH